MAKKSIKLDPKVRQAIRVLTEEGLLEGLLKDLKKPSDERVPKNPTIPHQYPWLDYEEVEIEDEEIEDEKYEGEWKNGKKHGQGTQTWSNGDKYVGEFKEGERTGQGTSTSAGGSTYTGEFKDGKKHGQGTYTYSNGDKYVGEWKDGWEWKGTEYNKEGNITGKLVNGEPQ